MPETARAQYTFLPYVRQGLAAALSATGRPAADGRLELPVRLRLTGGEAGAGDSMAVSLQLYGPGDVVGIDPGEIIRTEPRHLTADFEPQYFPLVEFDTPDFPWMFTPESPDAKNRVRPWLCLVVVEAQEAELRADAARPLSVLDCPLGDLPDLADAWAWAHAQVARTAVDASGKAAVQEEIRRVIAEVPQQNLSRLLCPRRLQPNTPYIACLVPTFEAGRLAGLGEPVTAESLSALSPAWATPGPQNAAQRVTLPVYHHWNFTTGAGAESFETLVRRLERGKDLPGVGRRTLDVSAPGWTLPEAPGARLKLEGALTPAASPEEDHRPQPDWTEAQRTAFQSALRELLNAPALGGDEPLVAPPIYGQQHAGRGVVPAPNGKLTWLQELNLDPRYRVAAGLGALIVRQQQEELMAEAWKQVEAVERANAVRRRAQLAQEVGASLFGRLTGLAPETLLQITEPAHDAVAANASARSALSREVAAPTLRAEVRDSTLPETALSPAFRRLVRPEGPVARRFASEAPVRPLRTLIETPEAAAPARSAETTLLSLENLASGLRAAAPAAAASARAATTSRIESLILEAVQPAKTSAATAAKAAKTGPEAELAKFRKAAATQQARLAALSAVPEAAMAPRLAIESVAAELKASLDPALNVLAAVASLAPAPDVRTQKASFRKAAAPALETLGPVIAAPQFPAPMYQPLREVHDMLLPGLENTPPNSLALLKTNPRFIEAYMVGLNHEFSRELLWREYPTDQRGTYFRQFWDPRAGETASYDLPPIDRWESGLGEHMLGMGAADAEGQLVILMRGDLLRKYPGAVIYAVKADPDGAFPAREAEVRHPRFRGSREPDIVFIGFDLSEADACGRGGPETAGGWFFVLQEQPTAPRFGLDPASGPLAPKTLKAWSDVSWGHLAATDVALDALTYASAQGPLAGKALTAGKARIIWGENAGHMARITLQRSYRIAIHATALLAQQTSA